MHKRLKITSFDWNKFVRSHVFEQVLISAAGVPITYLLVSNPEAQPEWLILNPALSVLCFIFAFLRVWKSLMEEVETSDAQDSIEHHLNKAWRMLDLIILPFYVFSLFLMPFFSVAFQFFIAILVLFYSISIFYNELILRTLPKYYDSCGYSEKDEKHCPVKRYFHFRRILDIFCLTLILFFGALAWRFAISGNTNIALRYGFICIIMLIIIEGLIEPLVNVDFHYFEEKSPRDKD